MVWWNKLTWAASWFSITAKLAPSPKEAVTLKNVIDAAIDNAGLRRLNALPPDAAHAQFLACCGAGAWADRMTARRPFASVEQVHEDATRFFANLSDADWKEAFSSHPQIGQTAGANAPKALALDGTSKWSTQEQSGVNGASQQIMTELAELNKVYFEKFGYIYIVCASGKSADGMLDLLDRKST